MTGPSSTKRALGAAEARARIEGVTIEVPASIANLGPGYDALAVAVQLYLRVTVRRVIEAAPGTVTSNLGLGGDDYVCRSVSALAAREAVELPGLELDISSDIPMQAGLGSSAAAIVAGLLLYDRVVGPARRDLLAEATALEGHPDNVAASLLGGLTVACESGPGRVVALSSAWPDEVRFVAATPDARLKTSEARDVLPAEISRADAVFNLQRVALLLQAIRTGRTELLREALADRWHQPYRVALVPGLSEALALTHPDLLGVCLSGSGPTIVALCVGETGGVERALTGIYSRLGLSSRVRTLRAHNEPPRILEPS